MAEERRRDEHPGDDGDALEQLDATDDGTSTALPPRLERWRRRSATGAIMTGFAFGLREVFEPERKEPSIMQETSGDPPKDLPVDAELDSLSLRRSVVRIRPWLLEGAEGEGAGAAGNEAAGTEEGEAPTPGSTDQ